MLFLQLQRVFERLPCFEFWHCDSWDLNLLCWFLRVDANASGAVLRAKSAKASDVHFTAAADCGGDKFCKGRDYCFAVLFR